MNLQILPWQQFLPGRRGNAVNGGTEGRKEATITVSWTNPSNQWDSVSATCYIAVQNTISINKKSYTVYTGQKTTYQLKAETKPAGR